MIRDEEKKKGNGTFLRDFRQIGGRNSSEPKGKPGLRKKGYVWVLKFKFFVEVLKGRSFSYTSYFLPSNHVRTILVQL